jgi:GTP pyrophosphokinase
VNKLAKNTIVVTHDLIFDEIKKYINHSESIDVIEHAYQYAQNKHQGQFRKSGEPYFVHLQNVAYILTTLKVGPQTICAGLLHDIVEDCDVTKDELAAEFDEEIATLVEAVTKIGNIQFKDQKEYQAANHRKIFIAMAKDIRVIIVKLVDRLHNMRTLEYMREDKQKRIAQETLDVYAPIAHRLGISNIKNELEDLCFFYLHSEDYRSIAKLVEAKKIERDQQVKYMIQNISKILTDKGIKFRIFGRSKHLYSIYKKMTTKNKRFEEILDLLALRIVTENELNCYEILGYIHATYRPIPGRLKDYIAMPKMNMYQSLHTTIVGEDGRIFEVQIRTENMDSIAEKGIAAHWRYKEGTNYNATKEQKEIESKLSWFKDLVSLGEGDDDENPTDYMETLTKDVFEANVYVMSPKGRVIDLPNGSTPIDFAYRIHSEVGNTTVGALVNESIVPLNTELKTGDVVSIMTNKSSTPSQDWLNIVKTNNARNKIRSFIARAEIESKAEEVKKGEQIVRDELKKRKFEPEEYMINKKFEELYGQFKVNNYIELMYAVSRKSISVPNLVEALTGVHSKAFTGEDLEKLINEKTHKLPSKTGIAVSGVNSMMLSLANCCKPVYGDEIKGYVTKGSGVKVHRANCPNIVNATNRLIEVYWDNNSDPRKYIAYVNVFCSDRNFLLTDIVTVISQCKASLQEVNSIVNQETLTATTKLAVLVDNLEHLTNVMVNLRKVNNVISVERVIR